MKEFFLIMPEIFLALTLCFIIIGEITYTGEEVRLIALTTLLGLGGAFVQTLISYKLIPSFAFGGVLSIDSFSLFFKLFFIGLSIFSVLAVLQTEEVSFRRRSEYCALVVAAALAMCIVASVTDLVLAFLSLLFLSVVSYFLSAYGKRAMLSTEAAVKSLAFGAVSIALFLYAIAILFDVTKTLNIYEMHKALAAASLPTSILIVVFMLSFLSLSYLMGAFPMSVIVPDVLEGAPTPVSAFLSVGSRAAGFAFAVRFLISVFAQAGDSPGQWKVLGEFDWTRIVSVTSALTMAVGALLALRQKGAKRLVSYLVVVETGFCLMGLAVLDEIGIAAILYNLVIELLALMGIYSILASFIDRIQSDRLDSLKGMLKRALPECICLILFLLCLVGMPPMPGFIGKFTLIGAAIDHHRFFLAGIGIGAIVLSTIAVARLAYFLVGDYQISRGETLALSVPRKVFLGSLLIPLFLVGVFANWVFQWVTQSLNFIFW